MEVWRPVKGYEDLYEISSFGRLKAVQKTVARHNPNRVCVLKSKILKLAPHTGGYFKHSLSRPLDSNHNKYIHRLVAEAFIPNPDNRAEINHINGIKTDNRVSNLEWATRSENIRHGYSTGLYKSRLGTHYNKPRRTYA